MRTDELAKQSAFSPFALTKPVLSEAEWDLFRTSL